MSFKGLYITGTIATVGVLGGAYYAYQLYNNFRKPKLPTEWKDVGYLKEFYIFPIKSVAPIVVNKAECTFLGLKDGWLRDRVLMVVDEKSNFITARVYPELMLVHPSIRGSILTLEHVDMEPISIDLAEISATKTPESSRVWGVSVMAYDCGHDASEWFSRLLKRAAIKFRLVLYASEKCRQLKHSIFKFTKNDTGAFGDEVSFSLMNEASVAELNTRLDGGKVLARQFRANFVLGGAQPFEEDSWSFIKIGDNVFEIIKPCFRCLITIIDPETGVRNPKLEPLETLRTYRLSDDPVVRRAEGNAPRLGVQIALRSTPGGIITLNDRVYAA